MSQAPLRPAKVLAAINGVRIRNESDDYRRAVQAQDGEEVVYSYIQWPDKATRDAGWARMMAEDPEQSTPMPFDGKRMFWGGFRPILDTAAE